MKIITLIENVQDESKTLKHEHGLSLYIETNNAKLIFDTGQSGGFVDNARMLGVDLQAVDRVVVSHGHYDHGGGLSSFFKINSRAVAYMKAETRKAFFARAAFMKKPAGIDPGVFSDYADRIRFVDRLTEIAPGVFLITRIPQRYPTPRGNRRLFVKNGKRLEHDSFDHELILVIREDNTLVVFTGCAHNGVGNMIESVREHFPGEKIGAVLGGFHLKRASRIDWFGASRREVDDLSRRLGESGIDRRYTGHCTGLPAFARLKNALGDKIHYLKTGTVLQI